MKVIVYVSQAKRPFDQDQLSALLDYSRRRNEADGITGLLIYRYQAVASRGNFLQILEGPDFAIEDVWERISSDPRHHSIVTLEEGAAEERMFPDWTMGFRDVEEGDLASFEGFTDLGSDAFGTAPAASRFPVPCPSCAASTSPPEVA